MTLRDALQNFIADHGYDCLRKSFFAKSVLSDLVKGDVYERKILLLFLEVDAEFNLVAMFKSYGLAGARQVLSASFKRRYASEWKWEHFRDAINALASIVLPAEYEAARKAKEAAVQPMAKAEKKENRGIAIGMKPPKNKPQPQKPATPPMQNVDFMKTESMSLICYDGDVTVKRVPGREVYATYQSGKKRTNLGHFSQKGKVLTLDLKIIPGPVIVHIGSSIPLKNLSIRSQDGTVELEDIRLEKLSVQVASGGIYGTAHAKQAKLKTEYGWIDVADLCDRLEAFSEYGDILLNTSQNSSTSIVIDATCAYGDIVLRTKSGKLSPRPTKWLGNTKNVNGVYGDNEGTRYDLRLLTPMGKIKIS